MAEPMVSAASFAKASNVTAAAVSKALKSGRLQAYSKAGRRVSPAFRGPKFLKLEEAKESFQYNRVGIDSAFLAKEAGFGDTKHGKSHQNLVNAKVEKERLQSELLEMRLAREQGDVIPRAAAIAAVESLGRAVQRSHKGDFPRGSSEWRRRGRFWAFEGQICGVGRFNRRFDHGFRG